MALSHSVRESMMNAPVVAIAAEERNLHDHLRSSRQKLAPMDSRTLQCGGAPKIARDSGVGLEAPPMRMRHLITVVGVALLVPGAFTQAKSAKYESPVWPGKVFVPSGCVNGAFKPTVIVYTCADARSRISGIDWDSWTRSKAVGSGFDRYPDCEDKPIVSCRHEARLPAQITLSRPRYCSNVGRNSFTSMLVEHTEKGTTPKRFTVPFPCSLLSD